MVADTPLLGSCKQARTDADTADSGGVSEADIVRVLREAAAANTPVKSATLTKAFRSQVLPRSIHQRPARGSLETSIPI